MDLDTDSLQSFMPYGTWRKRLFQFRFALDKHPNRLLTLQIVLGALINFHPGLSFVILTNSKNFDRFELAVIPLICLCIEIIIFTTSSLIFLLSENKSKNKHLATWHRDCAFSLLKDIYISSMILISLVLCIVYIDTEEMKLIFRSIFTMTLPIIILSISSLIKCILLKTTKTVLWCTLNVLLLAAITLLILKIDYKLGISWSIVIAPTGLGFVSLMACAVFSLVNRAKARDVAGIVFCSMSIAGCATGILSVVFVEQSLMFNIKAILGVKVTGWLTIIFLLIGYSRKSGAWLLGVVFGHMEREFWHFKYPTKTVALLSTRSKSI